MRLCTLLSLVLSVFSSSISSALETLPADAGKVVAIYNETVATLEREAASNRYANYTKLITQLKEIQAELTMKVLLDEAVVVRDLIRSQEQLQSDTERTTDFRRKVDAMPVSAKQSINTYLETDTKILNQLSDEIAERKATREAKLKVFFEKYTRAGDLDAAIAIRDELGGATLDLAPQKTPEEPSLGDDLAKARDLHREFCDAALKDFQNRTTPIVTRLISDLQVELTAQSKANKLDDAIKLRDFIKLLNTQQSPVGKFQVAIQQRRHLEGTVSRIVEEAVEKFREIENVYLKRIKSVNNQLATMIEPNLRIALVEHDHESAKALLQEYQMLKSRLTEFNQAISSRTPLPQDTAKEIETFENETQNRIQEYDQKEAKLRETLVSKLEKIIDHDGITDTEESALKNACYFARADYSTGLQGMLLYRIPDSITTLGKEAIEQHTELVKQFLRDRQESQDNAISNLTETLLPIVRQSVAEGRFLDAYKIRSYLPRQSAIFRPLTIKVTHSPYSDHLTDAKLIDVRGKNCFLVEYSVGREEWVPRSRIRYAPDDPIRVADLRKREEPDGPGVPVDENTKLEREQKAFKLWGASWLPVTIKELTPLGVVIQWGAWGKGGEEVVPRETLRLME